MNRLRLSCAVALLAFSLSASGCALLVVGAVGGGAAGAAASAKDHEKESHSASVYAGTVLANVVYVPAKVVFAGLGAATSGVAYVVTLGRTPASNSIWNASVNGDYVLTPRMIDGDQPVRFVG